MQELIEKYKLAPHPEGGYYAVVYESFQRVKSVLVNVHCYRLKCPNNKFLPPKLMVS